MCGLGAGTGDLSGGGQGRIADWEVKTPATCTLLRTMASYSSNHRGERAVVDTLQASDTPVYEACWQPASSRLQQTAISANQTLSGDHPMFCAVTSRMRRWTSFASTRHSRGSRQTFRCVAHDSHEAIPAHESTAGHIVLRRVDRVAIDGAVSSGRSFCAVEQGLFRFSCRQACQRHDHSSSHPSRGSGPVQSCRAGRAPERPSTQTPSRSRSASPLAISRESQHRLATD